MTYSTSPMNGMTVKEWIIYDLSDDDLTLEIPVLQEAFEVLVGTASESSSACQELMHNIETELALWDKSTCTDGESEVQVQLLVEQLMIKYKISDARRRLGRCKRYLLIVIRCGS